MASNKRNVKKAVKAAKKSPVLIAAVAVILVMVIAVTAILWFTKPALFHKLLGTGEHEWGEWDVAKQSTCVDTGERYRECVICGEDEKEQIPATGHEWGEYSVGSAATCMDAGNRSRKCANCGQIQEEDIPAHGHKWGDYIVKTQPSCRDGIKVHTCSICKEDEEETIPGTGEHVWGQWTVVTEATCGDGLKERECSVCHSKEEDTLVGNGQHSIDSDGICTVCGLSTSSPEILIPSSDLSIHFLELGNKYTGDCTLIKCGDTEVLIDAGSRKDSANTIKEYVDKYCTDGILEYVIATHAHQDHIAGFVGNSANGSRTGILYQYKVGTLIQFALTGATTQIYNDYCTAVEYAKNKGTSVYTANECWNETGEAKKQYYLDDDKTISINILYNYYYDHSTKEENDYSVCMLLTQQTESKTYNYLFTGDLEEKGESYLVDNNELPEVELFKGGHHGSYTATTNKLLKVIKPKNVAVCCCCGTTEYTSNTVNTFPAQAFIDRVSKYTENIYCTTLINDYAAGDYTSMNGNIVFYYNKGLKLYCSNNDTILKDTKWFKENRTWNS